MGHLRDLVGFLKDNSDWLVKFAQGVMVAAGILATYALATKIMEIGAAVEGLTAVLALNPWALLITGVVASGAIIYKTWSDTQARLEHDYEDLRLPLARAGMADRLLGPRNRLIKNGARGRSR